MTDEYESAAAEARYRGMAFLVDGRHVSADRVMILSVPDTTGPISSMRRAKVEAQQALADMESYVYGGKADYDRFRKDSEELESVRKELAKVREQLADAHADTERIDWLDKRGQLSESKGHMRWVIVTDSGIANLRLAMDSKGALKPFKSPEATARDAAIAARAALPTPVIVNDIVVTDPALLEPITDAAPGVTQSCGVCGAPFVAVDSLFCEAHRG